jgi:MFS family permease
MGSNTIDDSNGGMGLDAQPQLRSQRDVANRNRSMGFWWLVLFILVLHSEAVAFSFNLVSPTLIPVATEFHTTQLGWLYSALTLVGAVFTPLITRLGDIHGKKPMILLVSAIATLGAVLVAVAPSFQVVLLGRALEGVLLALIPLTYSLMRDTFPTKILAFSVTIAASGVGLVTILGPLLAGWLVDSYGWRSVFWFLAAETALGLVLIALIVPGSSFRAKAKLDVAGALLIGASLALLLLAISEGANWGWSDVKTIGCVLAEIVLFAVWVREEKRAEEPLISLEVLKRRSVATILGLGFLVQASLGLGATIIPILVQTPRQVGGDYGFGVSGTGLATFTSVAGAATVIAGFILGAIIRRTGAKLPALIGIVFGIVGCTWLAVSHESRWEVTVAYTFLGIAQGLAISAIPSLVIAAVPQDLQGISAGMSGTTQSLGGTLGPTVGFAILAAHVGQVLAGQPVYTNTGLIYAYLAAAVFGVLAFVVALAIPRLRVPGESTDAEPVEPERATA